MSVRGRQPRSGLMPLCSYVLLFPALAANKPRYGISPLPYSHIVTFPHWRISLFFRTFAR